MERAAVRVAARLVVLPVALALAWTVAAEDPASAAGDRDAPGALPWPAREVRRFRAGAELPIGFEPSGLARLPNGRVAVLDDGGDLVWIDPRTGAVANGPSLGDGDFEALCVRTDDPALLWVGVEHPPALRPIDALTGEVRGRARDVSDWVKSRGGDGLEGLTAVADEFWLGEQVTGKIERVRFSEEGRGERVGRVEPEIRLDDLSALHWEPATGSLWAVFDRANRLVEMDRLGRTLGVWELPGRDQEGVLLDVDCEREAAQVWIAQDSGEVVRYDGFPVRCVRPQGAGRGPLGFGLAAAALAAALAVAGAAGVRARRRARPPIA